MKPRGRSKRCSSAGRADVSPDSLEVGTVADTQIIGLFDWPRRLSTEMQELASCVTVFLLVYRPLIIYFRQPFYAKLSHKEGHVCNG